MKSKVLENKRKKKEKLLDAAFLLLIQRDIQNISIQDIVSLAGVAKGTFYLYFKDKYEIMNVLIENESKTLFYNAEIDLKSLPNLNFEDSVIFMIDHVLQELENKPLLLRFIKNNLSQGLFQIHIQETYKKDSYNLIESFISLANRCNYHFKNPKVTLYLIIELISSSCYESIINNNPLPIRQFKPYLFDSIRAILNQGKQES